MLAMPCGRDSRLRSTDLAGAAAAFEELLADRLRR
jgi:hypothetical protein